MRRACEVERSVVLRGALDFEAMCWISGYLDERKKYILFSFVLLGKPVSVQLIHENTLVKTLVSTVTVFAHLTHIKMNFAIADRLVELGIDRTVSEHAAAQCRTIEEAIDLVFNDDAQPILTNSSTVKSSPRSTPSKPVHYIPRESTY